VSCCETTLSRSRCRFLHRSRSRLVLGYGARAWNNYVADQYLKRSPQFKAVALIPMQDVSSAVVELRRAVKELGMVGVYVPSNGLRKHLSAKEFWPVYEEAEKLDCPIGIHGGWYRDLGFDTFTRFPGTRALGMPFPLAIAMTGMIQDGVWDAFPKLKIGFLEGGTSWIPLVIDRLEREREYGELRCEKPIIDYFRSDNFSSVARETRARCPMSSIASAHRAACSLPIFRTRYPWKMRCTRSMKFSNGKISTTSTKR
jgi:predicted TIM-barrel fold metal-dependent hydrolase